MRAMISQSILRYFLFDGAAYLLGDPGLGKSQLLQAAAAVSPRGIYVCGNATTNAGLTVAVVKDSMTSDYAFEAGNIHLLPSWQSNHISRKFMSLWLIYSISRLLND